MRLPKKFAQKSRKVFYFIHLWTGLILGLWLVMMGLTGTVLAFRSEFTGWEARRRVGATMPGPSDKIIPVSQAIAALKASDPTLTPERGLFIPPREYDYYLHYEFKQVNGERVTLLYLVNPVTGHVYPPIARNTMWIDTIEHLHDDLIAQVRGTVANGIFSFFTVFMLLSGLWLWWPSNWKQFKQRIALKRGMSLRRTLYDLHNVFGIYLFGLLLLLSTTGVLMVVNAQTERGITRAVDRWMGVKEEPRPRRGDRDGGRAGRRGERRTQGSATVSGGMMPDVQVKGQPLPVDVLVEKAKAALPRNTLLFVSFPQRPGQPFQTSFDPISFNNGLVLFDPYTGKRLEANGRTFTPGYIVTKMMGDLHYGWFAGSWSKFLYGFAGLLPLGLFITGTWMWLNKKRGQLKNRRRRAAEQAKPAASPTTTTAEVAADTR